MNACTKKHNVKIADDRWEYCEHLEVGDIAHTVWCEDDSFGPVGRYAVCEPCAAIEADKDCTCPNCGETVKEEELMTWTPYDFYAAQGDTPHELCERCWSSPNELERRRRDRELRDAEYDR